MAIILARTGLLVRIVVAGLLLLGLSGCVLQSSAPIFSDESGELALASYGSSFSIYKARSGSWQKAEEKQVIFQPVGGHYEIRAENSEATVIFVPLADSKWILQYADKGGDVSYALAEARNGELMVFPIFCDALAKANAFGDWIDFKGDDCFIKPGIDTKTMFVELAKNPGPEDMKLVPEP